MTLKPFYAKPHTKFIKYNDFIVHWHWRRIKTVVYSDKTRKKLFLNFYQNKLCLPQNDFLVRFLFSLFSYVHHLPRCIPKFNPFAYGIINKFKKINNAKWEKVKKRREKSTVEPWEKLSMCIVNFSTNTKLVE